MKRALLVTLLALFGCDRPTEVAAQPPPSDEAPSPAPAPVEAEPKPVAAAPTEPGPDRPFADSRKLRGNDDEALYGFEGDSFTTALELHMTIGDEGTGVELRHPKGGPGVLDDGPELCVSDFRRGTDFHQGDSLTAQILDHGLVADGRRLLEVWISCRLGEDIVSVESVVWLVLDDGKQLEQVWSGGAGYHGSHVCATYDDLEFEREGNEVVLTRTEVSEIYEPGIREYDCEDARESVEARGTERIALP